MNDAQELRNSLRHHGGGDQPYKHSLNRRFLYTAGVREFARNAGAGAYWLVDILATEPVIRQHVEREGFALAVLEVTGTTATLVVANDTTSDGERFEGVIYSKHIGFTDCPEGKWKFYLEPTQVGNVTGVMAMLPGER